MKYIDSEKLKADLESIYDNMLKRTKIDKDNSDYWAGRADAYRNIIDTIASLQQEQPEVDLEKEVSNYLKIYHFHIKDGGRVVFDNDDSPNFMCDIRNIARHFAEWGAIHLNARKEE